MLFRRKHRPRATKRLWAKKNNDAPQWLQASFWILSFFLALWLVFATWHRTSNGVAGVYVSGLLFRGLGQSAYLFPLLLLFGLGAILLKTEGKKRPRGIITFFFGALLVLGAVSSELALLRGLFPGAAFDGGALGALLAAVPGGILQRMFGRIGVFLLGIAVFFVGTHLLFGISWHAAARRIYRAMVEDYFAWLGASRELKGKLKVAADTEERRRMEEESAPPVAAPEKEPSPPPVPEPAPQKAGETQVPKPKIERPMQEERAGQPKPARKNFSSGFILPTTNLLHEITVSRDTGPNDSEIHASGMKLEETFKNFEIEAHVSGVCPGPVITRYEVTPAPGVKVSSIVALANDIALAMKAPGIRVIAPIPGKSAIGFEIPNAKPEMVGLREILDSAAFNESRAPLLFAIGRHLDGHPAVANLEKMPHMLVAGATNSGKSVFLHSLILSLLFRNRPDELKFLLIDPKRLELTFYDSIPHLYDPRVPCEDVAVVTDTKKASASLKRLTKVMEERYLRFEMAKVKNIAAYNNWAREHDAPPEFYIVVVIDELADLMLQEQKTVEESIQRLAQMARAVGIHLVLATQRPSVDVITGVIKANLPSRIALQVTSKMDSRVILDTNGAESLLGRGDMLYLATDAQKPVRIQGSYVSEKEIERITDFIKAQGKPDYPPPPVEGPGGETADGKGASPEEVRQALQLVLERRRVSQDLLKAHFGSSARATNILSLLEVRGFIRKPEGSNRWEIFFDKIEEFLNAPQLDVISPANNGNEGGEESADNGKQL